MKFQQYLNESKDLLTYDKFSKIFTNIVQSEIAMQNYYTTYKGVLRNCKPFLFIEQPLYRGISDKVQKNNIVKVRKDRQPKTTNEWVQSKIDEYYKPAFGWNIRSEGIFCLSDPKDISYYGSSYMIFPYGKFEYVWANMPNIKDNYDTFAVTNTDNIEGNWAKYLKKHSKSPEVESFKHYKTLNSSWFLPLIKAFEDVDKKSFDIIMKAVVFDELDYRNTNIELAISNKKEIIINCDKYYAIPLYISDKFGKLVGYNE